VIFITIYLRKCHQLCTQNNISMDSIGYLAALATGIALGLIGGGGSILTIPIMVYINGIAPTISTTYALFVVGVSALTGSINGFSKKSFDPHAALYLGLPSVIGILFMRSFVMPHIPDTWLVIRGFTIGRDLVIMIAFAILMVWAALKMIRERTVDETATYPVQKNRLLYKGFLIGLLTGFVGVGGGFLLIPALVITAKLPMQKAVPTSLLVIAVGSLAGFMSSIDNIHIDWLYLLPFTGFSVAGIFLGMYLNTRIANTTLKPVFGWFVLATGIYILVREIFF
jgi:uncharacterized protein